MTQDDDPERSVAHRDNAAWCASRQADRPGGQPGRLTGATNDIWPSEVMRWTSAVQSSSRGVVGYA
jgi:hypothetical protein